MVKLSREQKMIVTVLVEWLKVGQKPYLTVGGYAGTGKTTLIGAFRQLIHTLEPKATVAMCAYTGKASRVLLEALKNAGATFEKDTISTIHGLIYSPVLSGGHIIGWRRKEKINADLIIVDEASMVDGDIWHDLLDYEVPVLAVGDHGQLPPINGRFNLMAKPELTLNIIHRQAENNPIIKVSMMARESGNIPVGNYGQQVRKLNRYESASGQEVEEILQRITAKWLVLTGFNWTRVKLNQALRGYQEIEGTTPRVGDRVICLKNNWEKGIYNGMLGTIKLLIPIVDHGEISRYKVEISMDDELLYEGQILAKQFGQPTTLGDQKTINRGDTVDLFDFGYAITVHKAQGSQAPAVLLFEERSRHMDEEMWRRWLYTGVTRAQQELVIVGT